MKYNSIGEQLIAKAQELDPNYKPDKFNDMSEALDVILNNSGGDIWLDIAPYINEDNTSISQEGYDLVYNAFFPELENPSNKYAGILFMGYKMFFNEFAMSGTDKMSLNFITNVNDHETKGYIKVSIYNDKSVELGEETGSSNKVWYSIVGVNFGATNQKITQEQYNEIKALINNNSLAGIIMDFIADTKLFFPLLSANFSTNTFDFSTTNVSSEENGFFNRKSLDTIGCTIKSDLSITFEWNPNYFITLTQNLSSQSIPSIKNNGYQENLTIGDGLKIENGELKTKNLEMAISITATLSDLQNAVNSFSNIIYNESDKAEINSFIKNQKGIIKLTIATPVGNLYMTLRPTLWKDDDAHSYNFEGSLYIETDLSAIGGSTFNQIIVRAVTWDHGDVAFRPTIIPIGK